MGGLNTFGCFEYMMSEPKRKREESEDIPKPFLRDEEESAWRPTGANAIGIKKTKMETV
jgi:hypothetical protein